MQLHGFETLSAEPADTASAAGAATGAAGPMEGTSKSAYPPIYQEDTVHLSTKARFRPILRWDAPSEKTAGLTLQAFIFNGLEAELVPVANSPRPDFPGGRCTLLSLTLFTLYWAQPPQKPG